MSVIRRHFLACEDIADGSEMSAVGIVGGDETPASAQPATGGRSRRHARRCFGRLEQEEQR